MTERSTGEYVRLATDKDGEDARDGSRALTVIEPGRGWALHLGDLWPYRELLYFLVWRDIKVRYKQTAIGALWAVLQPVALTLVFTLFLGQPPRHLAGRRPVLHSSPFPDSSHGRSSRRRCHARPIASSLQPHCFRRSTFRACCCRFLPSGTTLLDYVLGLIVLARRGGGDGALALTFRGYGSCPLDGPRGHGRTGSRHLDVSASTSSIATSAMLSLSSSRSGSSQRQSSTRQTLVPEQLRWALLPQPDGWRDHAASVGSSSRRVRLPIAPIILSVLVTGGSRLCRAFRTSGESSAASRTSSRDARHRGFACRTSASAIASAHERQPYGRLSESISEHSSWAVHEERQERSDRRRRPSGRCGK